MLSQFVRGLYITLAIASGVGLTWSILISLLAVVLTLPLGWVGAPTGWVTWLLENVILWAAGASLAGLFVVWALPKLLHVLERMVVWLSREIREASK